MGRYWQAEDVGAYSLEFNSSSAEKKALETGECRASLVIIASKDGLPICLVVPFRWFIHKIMRVQICATWVYLTRRVGLKVGSAASSRVDNSFCHLIWVPFMHNKRIIYRHNKRIIYRHNKRIMLQRKKRIIIRQNKRTTSARDKREKPPWRLLPKNWLMH